MQQKFQFQTCMINYRKNSHKPTVPKMLLQRLLVKRLTRLNIRWFMSVTSRENHNCVAKRNSIKNLEFLTCYSSFDFKLEFLTSSSSCIHEVQPVENTTKPRLSTIDKLCSEHSDLGTTHWLHNVENELSREKSVDVERLGTNRCFVAEVEPRSLLLQDSSALREGTGRRRQPWPIH